MATMLKVSLSNRELERCILKEAGGCAAEDEINHIYDINTDVLLHSTALAKKLLGLNGVFIGNDPRKGKLLKPMDFDAERSKIGSDDPHRKLKLAEIDRAEEDYRASLAAFDAEAWKAVIDLEDRIMRRAHQMQVIGLVECNVDYIVPDAVVERELQLGGTGKIPLEGTIALTEEGKRCIFSGRTLRKKKNSKGKDRDEELELGR